MNAQEVQSVIAFLRRIEMKGNETPTFVTVVNTLSSCMNLPNTIQALPNEMIDKTLFFLNRATVGGQEVETFMSLVNKLRNEIQRKQQAQAAAQTPPAPSAGTAPTEVKEPAAEPELLEEKPPKKTGKKKSAKKG